MKSFHVYYQKNEILEEYDAINFLTQLTSCLFWKKNQGEIHLYCNQNHLNSLKKWKIDELYDSINLDCLYDMPFTEHLEKYWSFCKIHAIKKISESNDEFVVIDTDLWIHEKINVDSKFQFIGYHEEEVTDHLKNPYLNPNTFLSEEDVGKIDWSMNPINCAFMYLNSQRLVENWYEWVVKTITENKEKPILDNSADTIFIEQRLLSALAYTLGMKVGKLLPNIYFPHIPADDKGSEWHPKIGFNLENKYLSWNIKHVWGLKKYFHQPHVRSLIITTLKQSLNEYFKDWENKFHEMSKTINDIHCSTVESEPSLNSTNKRILDPIFKELNDNGKI